MMNRFVVYLFGAGSSAHRKETACHTTSPSLCGWRLGAWRGTSYVILPPQRDDYLCRSSSLILELSSGPFTAVAMIYRLCFNDSGIIVPSLWLATGCMERDVVCHTTAVANLSRSFFATGGASRIRRPRTSDHGNLFTRPPATINERITLALHRLY